MINQPVPIATEADLRSVLAREFPEDLGARAEAVLSSDGGESFDRGVVRVKLAVLKLANRDLAKLEYFVAAAATDYRDVLAWAEYPAHIDINATEQEKQAAVNSDWAQYQRWFLEG